MNINSEVKKRIQHKDANHKARRILSFLGAALLGAGVACAISVPLMLTQCSDQHIFGNVTSNNMKNLREAGDEIKFNISLTKKVQAIYLTMDSGDFLDYDNQIEINGVSVDNTNDPWFSLYNSQDKKISNFDFSVKLMKDSYWTDLLWHMNVNVVENPGNDPVVIGDVNIPFLYTKKYLPHVDWNSIINTNIVLCQGDSDTLETLAGLKGLITSNFGEYLPQDERELTSVNNYQDLYDSLQEIDNPASFASVLLLENWLALQELSKRTPPIYLDYTLELDSVSTALSLGKYHRFDFDFTQAFDYTFDQSLKESPITNAIYVGVRENFDIGSYEKNERTMYDIYLNCDEVILHNGQYATDSRRSADLLLNEPTKDVLQLIYPNVVFPSWLT